MRHFGLPVLLIAVSMPLSAGDVLHVSGLATRYPGFSWSSTRLVQGDFNRDGKQDRAALGIAADKVVLALLLHGKHPELTEIAVDPGKQFGVCPGTEVTIAVRLQSEAPRNALGATPQGYEICTKCIEIVVSGGDCDPLLFYWNKKSKKLAWWRA